MTRKDRGPELDLKALFTDDRAVSPVIGVILMVAITVILAAVIGTFVLGLGQNVQQTTPSASFGFDYDGSPAAAPNLTITHQGGDPINYSLVTVTGNISDTDAPANSVVSLNGDGELDAGDQIETSMRPDSTVRVVWNSPSDDRSTILGRFEGPDA